MKNLGTFGASIAIILLLGHSITSGMPFLAALAWKLIFLIVSVILSIGVFFFVGKVYENPLLAWLSGGMTMMLLILLVGVST